MTPRIQDARLLVVKVGSALVADGASPRTAWLDGVAADIAAARAGGAAVIVVSSGAIALARSALGLLQPRLRLEEKQAAAAVGQIRLAQAWAAALGAHGLTAAQLLLTRAYARGNTLVNASLQYLGIAFSYVYGVVLFADRLSWPAVIGMAAIVAAGVLASLVRARHARREAWARS